MTDSKTADTNTAAAVSAMILILDFGSQYSHLIARRVRELKVYCELQACTYNIKELDFSKVKGIILSGGPASVYEEGSPHVSADFWATVAEHNVPVLGICYGFQEMAQSLGGSVGRAAKREYGYARLEKVEDPSVDTTIMAGVDDSQVWMSHGDKVTSLPEGFQICATTQNAEMAAAVCAAKRMYGLQFHPEVSHTKCGTVILGNFVNGICGCEPTWTMENFVETAIAAIRAKVGPEGHVIGALSGGVDSTVAGVLLTRAIGDRFHGVLVDNGLLRKDEAQKVLKALHGRVNLRLVDATDRFMEALSGLSDPEAKRKAIGHTFIRVFEAEADAMDVKPQFLLQGTLYPDVIESVSYKGPSATIKSHHNVGGLLANMRLQLIEPFRELFKDEVRTLGCVLGVDHDLVYRHPFPGPGLGIRVLGEITPGSLAILREADDIFLQELHATGHYTKIGQAFAVLLPCKSVGVMGDGRTYEQVIALRAVTTSDFMTATWYEMPYDVLARVSTRIINEVRGVNRVVYDISSKPPSTIEWE